MVAVEVFVELVSSSVSSMLYKFFSFFFHVVSALNVLTGYRNNTSWACHNNLEWIRIILTNLNEDTALNVNNNVEYDW